MKMLKSSALASLMLLMGLLFMYSCGKEELTTVDAPTVSVEADIFSKIKVKDGILAFEDQDHYQSILDAMVEHPEQVRTELAKKTDFVSLQNLLDDDLERHIQGEPTILDADKYFTTVPDYDLKIVDFSFYSISGLMNKDAALYIGDQLIQFTSDFVYTLHSGDPIDLGQTARITEAGRHGEIYASEVQAGAPDEERIQINHSCTATNAANSFLVQSGLTVNAFATQRKDGTFFNYQTIDFRIRKYKSILFNGVPLWSFYPCGGANIDAGTIETFWGFSLYTDTYPDQTQTNHAASHSFLIASRGPIWNTNEFILILNEPNSHGTTGEFTLGDCLGDPEMQTEYIGCDIVY